jgi:hypothetical protein
MLSSCENMIHGLCGRKTSRRFCGPENPQVLSTATDLVGGWYGCAEGPARAAPGCYDSTMCSIEGGSLRRVAEAIDRLEADRQNTDAADLEARIAAVWSMVGEIDPELARLASGYRNDDRGPLLVLWQR